MVRNAAVGRGFDSVITQRANRHLCLLVDDNARLLWLPRVPLVSRPPTRPRQQRTQHKTGGGHGFQPHVGVVSFDDTGDWTKVKVYGARLEKTR
jgi:hypothetical protein